MTPVRDGTRAGTDLRAHLRAATMAAHDLLDAAMQAASGWQTRNDYAAFLSLQHSARAPIEDWLAAHAPRECLPPPQTPLIARDLALLGEPIPAPAPVFTLGRTGAGHALGAAWVLAGSALGNRAIARQVARIGGGAWPDGFLGDAAMMHFWQTLRARIESGGALAQAEAATHAAEAVFAHFLAAAKAAAPRADAAHSVPA